MTDARTGGVSLVDALEAVDPSSIAIDFFEATLSYGELDRLTRSVAHGLTARGVSPGDRVGVLFQNDPEYLVALFAAWRAGATVVPLSPMLRPREIATVLSDAGVRVVICLKSLAAAVTASGAPLDLLVTTSERWAVSALTGPSTPSPRPDISGAVLLEDLAQGSDRAPLVSPAMDDIAVLNYTSGTTGPPKGAMVSHRHLATAGTLWRGMFDIGRDDVVLGLSPLFHISGMVGHIAAAVGAGAPLVLMHRFDPRTVLDACLRTGATTTAGPITAYVALLRAGASHRELGTLTKAASGGAAVPASVAARFTDATGVRIHQGYGLTESTGIVAGTPIGVQAPVDGDSGALAVGKAVSGTEIRIVDEDGRPVASGARGEIVVRGPQVIRGYWNRPDETAHAIRDGWLHTGDIGILDDHGWLFVVDRLKDLIVASGFKVWPGEVEEALHRHPDVAEVAVVGEPDDYRGETVVAHVSLTPGASVTEVGLAAHCRAELAAYKCPTRFVVHDELPKSATGKILRRLVRDPAPETKPAPSDA
ncbi:long-chain fatty acid--CoA ligase [Rhodococcus sp. WS4]|nr:long-chain fatty acid--CoA ligase [Rhodococcus sp. WS4]